MKNGVFMLMELQKYLLSYTNIQISMKKPRKMFYVLSVKRPQWMLIIGRELKKNLNR